MTDASNSVTMLLPICDPPLRLPSILMARSVRSVVLLSMWPLVLGLLHLTLLSLSRLVARQLQRLRQRTSLGVAVSEVYSRSNLPLECLPSVSARNLAAAVVLPLNNCMMSMRATELCPSITHFPTLLKALREEYQDMLC